MEDKKMSNIETRVDEEELQEQAMKKLEYYVETCDIYIDTCSLLHFASIDFFDHIEEVLLKYSKKLYILSGGIKELEKHSKNTEDQNLSSNAKKTLRMIKLFENSNVVEIIEQDGFVDNAFLALFMEKRMYCQMLLITQDKNLATDVLNLNNTLSVRANTVRVKKINQYGYLSDFIKTEEHVRTDIKYTSYQMQIIEKYGEIKAYISERIRSVDWRIDIKLEDAEQDEFERFCRYYIIEKIFEIYTDKWDFQYTSIAKLINCVDPILFENLNKEANRVLLALEIDSLFKSAGGYEYDVKDIVQYALVELGKIRYGDMCEINTQNEICVDSHLNFEDYDEDAYEYFCRVYLMEKIYAVLPSESGFQYGSIAKLINCVDPILFENLNKEANRVLLALEIDSLFKSAGGYEYGVKDIVLNALIELAKNRYGAIYEINARNEICVDSHLKFEDYDEDAYEYFCRVYLMEKIYAALPNESGLQYGSIAKLINYVDPILFENISEKIGRTLLINEIESLLRRTAKVRISRELISNMVDYLGENKKC